MLRRASATQQRFLRSALFQRRPSHALATPQTPLPVCCRPCQRVPSYLAISTSIRRLSPPLSILRHIQGAAPLPLRLRTWRAAFPASALPLPPAHTATATSVLRTPAVCCSSTCGGLRSTRRCLGGGARSRPPPAGIEGAASPSSSSMRPVDETAPPTKPRRGRPPGSAVTAARQAPRTAAKRTGGTAAKSASAAAAVVAAVTAAAAPSSSPSASAAVDGGNATHTPASSRVRKPATRISKATVKNDSNGTDDDDNDRAGQEDAELYSGRYELEHDDLCAQTSVRLNFPLRAVRFVLTQSKEGATVPFLARYRQGETGRMDEAQLRQVLDTAKEVREVHRRRQFMLQSLQSRGLLTPALEAALAAMAHMSQLEDAWEPYKERRTSLASRGRAEGLGSHATALLHFNPDDAKCVALLKDLRATLRRVDDGERLLTAIVAEDVQRSETLRLRLGDYCRQTTRLTCTMVNKPRKKAAKEMQEENFEHLKKHFAYYAGKTWSVDRIAAHKVLAIQRGEAKGVLQVETTSGPRSHGLFLHVAHQEFSDITRLLPPSGTLGPALLSLLPDVGYCCTVLRAGLQAAYDYLLKQSATAVRRDLKKSAEQEAIAVFAHNLHHMLLQRPLAHSRVLAMDPGHKHGVKCVALDEHGGVEGFFTCTLMDEAKMRQYVTKIVEEKKLNKIVIGNGTASGETSALVADLIKTRNWSDVEFAVVSEAGASVYSVSDIAKEEFPSLSVMYRGAVSIGRRVLDPLSELVKIPVRSMGIGMYQHDVNEKELLRELGYVLESCVAKVGINAVSANRYVMEKVPGIHKKIVDQIVLARHAKKLHSREDLRRVPAMTESVYEQIAGFFRFPNSPEPLDNTNIHPESYSLVRRLVDLYSSGQLSDAAATARNTDKAGSSETSEGGVGDGVTRQSVARAVQQLSPLQLSTLATQRLSCTVETLELVAAELLHPGLDPRASLPHAGLLRREVQDVKDLRSGQVLSGVVQSVTMFGAFVDCGLHDSVLVRGDGVDALQVGAYLKDRIRFEALDHMKRPRMFLIPDVEGERDGGHGIRRGHRLRLESEDVFGAETRDVPMSQAHHAEREVTAKVIAPQSLSATLERERRRRALEESKTNINNNNPSSNGSVREVARGVVPPSPTGAPTDPYIGQYQGFSPRQSASTSSNVDSQPLQRQQPSPSRAQKRVRSPEAELSAPAAPPTKRAHREPANSPARESNRVVYVDAQSVESSAGSSGDELVFTF